MKRRWLNFRQQVLPIMAFAVLVLFTLFFWRVYVAPLEQSQGVQVKNNNPVQKEVVQASAANAEINGSMGFIGK